MGLLVYAPLLGSSGGSTVYAYPAGVTSTSAVGVPYVDWWSNWNTNEGRAGGKLVLAHPRRLPAVRSAVGQVKVRVASGTPALPKFQAVALEPYVEPPRRPVPPPIVVVAGRARPEGVVAGTGVGQAKVESSARVEVGGFGTAVYLGTTTVRGVAVIAPREIVAGGAALAQVKVRAARNPTDTELARMVLAAYRAQRARSLTL